MPLIKSHRKNNQVSPVATGVLLISLLTASLFAQADETHYYGRIFSCSKLIKANEKHGVFLVLGDTNINLKDVKGHNGLDSVWTMNPINGLCYPAYEPLAGTLADTGTPWTRLANALVENKQYDKVLLIPIILPKSDIAEWKVEGKGGQRGKIVPRVVRALDTIAKQGLKINAILWQQGLTNDLALQSKDDYIAAFSELHEVLREKLADSPLYIARTGTCIGDSSGYTAAAQSQLPALFDNVYAGPDLTDASNFESRECRLTSNGVDAYVKAWVTLLTR